MNQKNQRRVLSGLLALAGSALLPGHVLAAASPAAVERDVELDILLTQKARDILERVHLVDGQARSRRVDVSADIASGVVTVALDRAFLPADYGPSFEDQRSEISFGLLHWAEQAAPFSRVIYLYDGKEVEHYFPAVQEAGDAAREKRRQRRERSAKGAGMAFVAAGHGYFYSHRSNDWVTSRQEVHGVSEGLVTPAYADALKQLIEQRSRMPAVRPRVQQGSGAIHSASGKEWWAMAARYAIAEQYPAENAIWNTYAGSTLWDREEREDINSRPLLANHIDAEVAIHLHSNAEATGNVRGARVIVQPGQGEDAALGRSVLCAMKEIINAQPGYESFTVAPDVHADNKGENREAHMPSIIVETAFHTNPDDARALLDPVFRSAAMKGVEKGYRLWATGKACEPLSGQPIADVDVPSGDSREVDVAFAGHPQFPISLITRNTLCPSGWICTERTVVIDAPDQPSRMPLSCGRNSVGTLGWETHVLDADGVKSQPVPHTVRCVAAAGGPDRNGLPENTAAAGM